MCISNHICDDIPVVTHDLDIDLMKCTSVLFLYTCSSVENMCSECHLAHLGNY